MQRSEAIKSTSNTFSFNHFWHFWVFDVIAIIFIASVLLFYHLGVAPLHVPDGGRYAEIPREMLATGHFITPHLNGVIYLEKPPLFYWLQAFSLFFFGQSEWSLRFWPVIFGIIGSLSIYSLGYTFYSRRTGLFASLILITSPLYYEMARRVSIDMPVTALITVTLCTFMIANRLPQGMKKRLLCWLCYTAAALAILTKGLIGFVIPGAILFLWFLYNKEWQTLTKMYIPSGILIFLIIALPWHILVQQQNPDFFQFYFINQHFLRYLTKSVGHYKPFWFFIPVLIAGFFPWIFFLIQSCSKVNSKTIFLLIWAAFVFIFFSISKSKLIPYILPAFPPLALLVANYITNHKYNKKNVFIVLIIMTIVFLSLASHIYNVINDRSVKPITTVLKKHLKPQDTVVSFKKYYQDLPFYLKRRVVIVDWINELRFGKEHQNTDAILITEKQLWQRWNSKKRYFVVSKRSDYQVLIKKHPHLKFYPIALTKRDILLSNHPLPKTRGSNNAS